MLTTIYLKGDFILFSTSLKNGPGQYRNTLKKPTSTISALYPHRQRSLAPEKKFEKSHCQIPDSAGGIPLVFLHGVLGSSADWEPVCSFLPPCECIGFDLPGHGKSPFVEDFVIDIPRFHLIGYSMGGRIAMAYAQKHPEQVASLTVMSAHPGLKSEEEKEARLKSDREWAQLLFTLPIDEFLFRWYNQTIFKPFQPDLTMRKQQNIPDLAAAFLHFSLAKQPFYEIDEVLVGERDEKFRALYKNPVLIPDAGHMVHLENPAFVAKIIEKRVFS